MSLVKAFVISIVVFIVLNIIFFLIANAVGGILDDYFNSLEAHPSMILELLFGPISLSGAPSIILTIFAYTPSPEAELIILGVGNIIAPLVI